MIFVQFGLLKIDVSVPRLIPKLHVSMGMRLDFQITTPWQPVYELKYQINTNSVIISLFSFSHEEIPRTYPCQ